MFSYTSKMKTQNFPSPPKSQYLTKIEPGRCDENQDHIQFDKIDSWVTRLNKSLQQFGQMRIGNLNSAKAEEKYKTLQLIQAMIQEMYKFQDTQNKIGLYRRKTDQFLLEKQELIEKISKEQKLIESEKELLLAKKENLQRTYKDAIDKLTSEKEQAQKQLKRIQAREKAFQAQFRKKDNQIKSLQDGIKKIQERSHSKSHFEVYDRPVISKKKQMQSSGINEYNVLALEKIEETLRNISEENAELKKFLEELQIELNSIFILVNEKIMYAIGGETIETLKIVRQQINSQPFQSTKTAFKDLKENMAKLRKFIELKQQINEEEQLPQAPISPRFGILPLPGIKDLIQNYKQIVKSQDQLLNKMIIKSQQFIQDDIQVQQRCKKALDDYEFDKVKLLIKEQMDLLQDENNQLSKTKQKLNQNLRRVEKIKSQICEERFAILNMNC